MTSIARLIALPIVSAGIIGGAALGLAGMANAQSQAPTGPGYSYAPAVKAHPPPASSPARTTTTARSTSQACRSARRHGHGGPPRTSPGEGLHRVSCRVPPRADTKSHSVTRGECDSASARGTPTA